MKRLNTRRLGWEEKEGARRVIWLGILSVQPPTAPLKYQRHHITPRSKRACPQAMLLGILAWLISVEI